jgi:hypothetical protein
MQPAAAPVHGEPPEDAGLGVFGPIGALSIPAEAVPAALLAMAALAVLLLALASFPPPARTSPTGAMLVHMRGSIALTGVAALAMAITTYVLL